MSPRNRITTSRSETGRVRHRHRRAGLDGQHGEQQRPAGPVRAGRPDAEGRMPVRPELRWEVIEFPGGRYVARRVPVAHLLLPAADTTQTGSGGVLVVDTHDLQLAATTAWPRWCEHVGGRLPAPRVGWWRSLPADTQLTDRPIVGALAGAGAGQMWWPARPGSPGAVPAVEWPAPPPEPRPWPWLGAPACDRGER